MAANTFNEMVRSLRLYVPHLPIMLAQHFVRDRYRRILDRRNWSGLRAEGEFLLNAVKTAGTVTLFRNNAEVGGVGTAFTATDLGRQFRSGVSPIYTIVTVDVPNQLLTLDRPIGIADAVGATYQVLDAYVTVPDDFMKFVTVTDPQESWRLRFWVTAQELNQMDPQRTMTGTPYLLADRIHFNGIPQYEAWPYSLTARTIYYTYVAQGADLLLDDDVPIWPIRSDAIVSGALADACRWPGTAEKPNPYFSDSSKWKSYEAEYEDKLVELERQDEDIYNTWLQSADNLPLAPLSDTNFNFNHA